MQSLVNQHQSRPALWWNSGKWYYDSRRPLSKMIYIYTYVVCISIYIYSMFFLLMYWMFEYLHGIMTNPAVIWYQNLWSQNWYPNFEPGGHKGSMNGSYMDMLKTLGNLKSFHIPKSYWYNPLETQELGVLGIMFLILLQCHNHKCCMLQHLWP